MINRSRSADKDFVVDLIQILFGLKSTDKSLLEFLKEMMHKYDNFNFDVELIESELAKRDELIEYWLEYSEDKRATGYYFKRKKEVYQVGNLDSSIALDEVWAFDNGIKACAFFIQRELNLALAND